MHIAGRKGGKEKRRRDEAGERRKKRKYESISRTMPSGEKKKGTDSRDRGKRGPIWLFEALKKGGSKRPRRRSRPRGKRKKKKGGGNGMWQGAKKKRKSARPSAFECREATTPKKKGNPISAFEIERKKGNRGETIKEEREIYLTSMRAWGKKKEGKASGCTLKKGRERHTFPNPDFEKKGEADIVKKKKKKGAHRRLPGEKGGGRRDAKVPEEGGGWRVT